MGIYAQFTPEQINKITEIAVYNAIDLNDKVSDINALNKNYQDKSSFLKIFEDIEKEQGNYITYGFTLDSIDTFDTKNDNNEYNKSIIYSQLIMHYTDLDLDEEIDFKDLGIKVKGNNDSLTLFCGDEEFRQPLFVFNIIFSDLNALSFVNTLLEGNSLFQTHNITLPSTIQTFPSFLSSKFGDYIRFSSFMLKDYTNSSNYNINNETLNIIYQNLNISSTTVLKTAYYALLDMTQQQILNSLDYSSDNSPLLTNVLYLNQKVSDITSQLSFYQNYKIATLKETNQTIDLFFEEDMYSSACNYFDEVVRLHITYPKPGSDFPYEVPEQTRNVPINWGCKTQNPFAFPLKLTTDIGNYDFDINFKFYPITVPSYKMIPLNNPENCEASGPYLTYNCLYSWNLTGDLSTFLPTYSEEVIIPVGSNIPVIKDPAASISYIFEGAFNGEIKLTQPKVIQQNNNGQISWGISFHPIFLFSSSIYEIPPLVQQIDWRAKSSNYIECHDNTNHTTDKTPIAIFLGLYSGTYAPSHSILKCSDDYTQYLPFKIYKKEFKNLIVRQKNNQISFGFPSGNIPEYYYSVEEAQIENQLEMIANEIPSIENRITNLESAGDSFLDTMLNIFSVFSSTIDFAVNIYDKVKYLSKLSKVFKNTISKATENAEALASSFLKKIRTLKKSSEYNPLEAVNEATVFAYQHGHAKIKWRNPELETINTALINREHYIENIADFREMLQTNPALYLDFQEKIGRDIKFPSFMNVKDHGFGYVSALSSPIEQIPVVNKIAHDISTETSSARSFLSNQYQTYPFHSSVSIRNFELEEDKIIYNVRFAGVGEPSIVGPTNAKNPRVKVGYIKTQYDIDFNTNELTLRNWDKTKIVDDRVYTKDEVDALYYSYINNKNSFLSTDEKWELIVGFTNKKIASRNVIDSIPLPNDIFLKTLDDLTFFSKLGNAFKYNLFSNNCQTFAKVFAQLATKGYTELSLKNSDFAQYAKVFQKYASKYTSDYFKEVVKVVISYKELLINHFKLLIV